MSEISKRLKRAMELQECSISELSRRSGINKGLISRYVNGSVDPKQSTVSALSRALGVSPIWLLGFDDEKQDFIVNEAIVEVKKLSPDGQLKVKNFIKFLLFEEGIEENGDPEV